MSYSLIAEKEVTARKQHPCIWCRERVEVGQKYIAEQSTYDSGFQNHHWHPECRKASVQWFRESCEEEFDPHHFKRGTAEEA